MKIKGKIRGKYCKNNRSALECINVSDFVDMVHLCAHLSHNCTSAVYLSSFMKISLNLKNKF